MTTSRAEVELMQAAGMVSVLPLAVRNLLALHSMVAAWRRMDQHDRAHGPMGFRLYSLKDNMATTNRFVNVIADGDYNFALSFGDLKIWKAAIRRWEQLYGHRP